MIGILGAGAFGGALAVTLGRAGVAVRLWGRDGAAIDRARTSRCLARLPDATLPDAVALTAELSDLGDCETLLFAVPMQSLGAVLRDFPLAPRHAVAACKGVDRTDLKGPAALLSEALPDAVPAILSGPSFATDIARGLPTALTLGCADPTAAMHLQARLSTPTLRLYRSPDVPGVELGGALKNVVAIACGAAVGAGLGESARAALMTRGMAEMMRLVPALGADPRTLMGLSGLGDLALTCASPQSRNFALGRALGAGEPPPEATTEGAATAGAALALAVRHGVELPITRAVAALVDGRTTVKDAMRALLDRDLTEE